MWQKGLQRSFILKIGGLRNLERAAEDLSGVGLIWYDKCNLEPLSLLICKMGRIARAQKMLIVIRETNPWESHRVWEGNMKETVSLGATRSSVCQLHLRGQPPQQPCGIDLGFSGEPSTLM